jgi:hypothetical protein
LNEQKHLSPAQIAMMLPNMAYYLDCLPPLDLSARIWTPLFAQLEVFCTRLVLFLPLLNGNPIHSNLLLRIMGSRNRVAAFQLVSSRSSILDSFANIGLVLITNILWSCVTWLFDLSKR